MNSRAQQSCGGGWSLGAGPHEPSETYAHLPEMEVFEAGAPQWTAHRPDEAGVG
jgi:hypothetical protein